ncbi:MAG: hypothetical protein AVDCRST_MAG20-2068 [uncultured Acidimicrobiales bacterium]|uniref:Uncharacterized protein n=1 Tax=uncultured Acidimicrobiales bacterium TaxID=310071 RepID=A0A6J4IE87_9ACTN|nr:MAG: hypothetical protein AVDCRST_MAG20-2068 [uncultured Acidimicrobiales bacterium]
MLGEGRPPPQRLGGAQVGDGVGGPPRLEGITTGVSSGFEQRDVDGVRAGVEAEPCGSDTSTLAWSPARRSGASTRGSRDT